MKRTALVAGLLAAFCTGAAHAKVEQDLRCFKSGDGASPIRFEFRMFSDSDSNWSGGYVRYKGAKQVIPIVLKSEQATEMAPDRPYEVVSTWVEIVGGKVTGEYVMDSQGAIVSSMTYTKFSPRRTFAFVDDLAAFPDGGGPCKW
ncbi:hypothetical protein [Burkholderia sp. Ac-20379]|uniref:hypothetical protein n=1 Tax=Burkholderia sp. Ac-20379 TaxID=2703900 RepID=UPI00198010D7|nr:hypothetical protein [Burkholderia sp. Ac-20379]MBN3727105.1 hypothetical protein [Burkholderia sp. Ac-20379]